MLENTFSRSTFLHTNLLCCANCKLEAAHVPSYVTQKHDTLWTPEDFNLKSNFSVLWLFAFRQKVSSAPCLGIVLHWFRVWPLLLVSIKINIGATDASPCFVLIFIHLHNGHNIQSNKTKFNTSPTYPSKLILSLAFQNACTARCDVFFIVIIPKKNKIRPLCSGNHVTRYVRGIVWNSSICFPPPQSPAVLHWFTGCGAL